MLPGLADVLSAFDPGMGTWSRAAWFLGGDVRLNAVRPLDALRQGEVEATRRAAAAYGEHGAA